MTMVGYNKTKIQLPELGYVLICGQFVKLYQGWIKAVKAHINPMVNPKNLILSIAIQNSISSTSINMTFIIMA
jgi:hypothetical protein